MKNVILRYYYIDISPILQHFENWGREGSGEKLINTFWGFLKPLEISFSNVAGQFKELHHGSFNQLTTQNLVQK